MFMCLYVSLGAWCTQCLPTSASTEDAVVEFNSRTCVYMYSVKSDKMCEVEVAVRRQTKARRATSITVWRAQDVPLALRWHVEDIGEKQAKTNKSKSKTL